MSAEHSLSAIINVEFSLETVYQILNRGQDLGFIYYDKAIDKGIDAPLLSAKAATDRLLRTTYQNINFNHLFVLTTIEDTRFSLQIAQSENNLTQVSFDYFSNPWQRAFFYTTGKNFVPDFDYSRYTRLLLKLCEDFSLKELLVEADLPWSKTPIPHQNEIYIYTVRLTQPNLDAWGTQHRPFIMQEYEHTLLETLDQINENITDNKIILFKDELFKQQATFSKENIVQKFLLGLPVTFFAKSSLNLYSPNQEIYFKIFFDKSWIQCTPLKPYYLKKSFNQNNESLDFSPYMKIGLELCSNILVSRVIVGKNKDDVPDFYEDE